MKKAIWLAGLAGVVVALAAVMPQPAGRENSLDVKASAISSTEIRLAAPAIANASAFPLSDAGLSAYVNVGAGNLNLDTIVKQHFTNANVVIAAGDNYIVGIMRIKAALDWDPVWVDVRLYADTQGWLVAFLDRSMVAAATISWDNFNASPVSTVLDVALSQIPEAYGLPIGWYHWAYPEATHLVIAQKVGGTSSQIYFALPFAFELYDASLSIGRWDTHAESNYILALSGTSTTELMNLYVPGGFFKVLGVTDKVVAEKGQMFRVMAASSDSVSFIGLAIVYKAP